MVYCLYTKAYFPCVKNSEMRDITSRKKREEHYSSLLLLSLYSFTNLYRLMIRLQSTINSEMLNIAPPLLRFITM